MIEEAYELTVKNENAEPVNLTITVKRIPQPEDKWWGFALFGTIVGLLALCWWGLENWPGT